MQEDGRTVATKKATGDNQTITFTAPTGDHSYVVSATDAAGNTSSESDAISVTADATKPATTLTPHAPTPLEGAARIDVNTEAGASYTLAVTGQKTITGTGSGTRDTHLLWLRNGTYHAVVTSTDAAGNATRVERDLRVANPSAALTVTQTSAPFHSPSSTGSRARLAATAPSRMPGQDPQAFDLDDTGSTTLSLPLPDGSYENGTANLTDFGGRTARADLPATVVDTTPPALAFSTNAARANDGTLAVAVTAEKAAKVTISAVRRGDDRPPHRTHHRHPRRQRGRTAVVPHAGARYLRADGCCGRRRGQPDPSEPDGHHHQAGHCRRDRRWTGAAACPARLAGGVPLAAVAQAPVGRAAAAAAAPASVAALRPPPARARLPSPPRRRRYTQPAAHDQAMAAFHDADRRWKARQARAVPAGRALDTPRWPSPILSRLGRPCFVRSLPGFPARRLAGERPDALTVAAMRAC